jgi:uncharacterized UPF0160 family protein
MKKIITHNGTFHADDVFAVATLMLAHSEEQFEVVRTRDKDVIASADFVVDVGGVCDGKKLFDHHQAGGAGMHENGIPYASFGLVWKEFGALVCGDMFVKNQIEDGLVSSLDAHDNGVKISEELYPVSPYEISHYISSFNPTWLEEEKYGIENETKRREVFLKLVVWAKELIGREIKRHKDKNVAYTQVKEIYEKSKDKRIIVLDRYMPWQDAIMEAPEPMFVVYPQGDGWGAKTVPKERHSFESRVDFPASWAGKMDKDLADLSGVSDATFCHNKLFLAVAKSREGAIKLAEIALTQK